MKLCHHRDGPAVVGNQFSTSLSSDVLLRCLSYYNSLSEGKLSPSLTRILFQSPRCSVITVQSFDFRTAGLTHSSPAPTALLCSGLPCP